MGDVKLARLGDVAEVVMGQSPAGEDCNRDGIGIPLLNGPTEFGSRSPIAAQWTTAETKVCVEGDTLFCVRGSTTGRMNIADQKYCIGRGLAAIRGEDNSDSRYVNYLIAWHLTSLLMVVTGSTFPNLSRNDLLNLQIEWPKKSERVAITNVLGALDDKIESNRRLQLLLDTVIEAEFVRATNGSNVVHFGHSLDVVMGAPFGGDHFGGIGQGRPLIRIRDLKTFAPQTWTTESRADEVLVRAGDVVVGMDAEFRSTLWVGEVGLLNQRVCKFVPKAGVATAFAWYAIRSDLEYCERAKSGTTVIHLNKGDIDRFSVPELSPSEHQDFSDLTEPMLNRLVSAGLENLRLAALRDALLPELLSGRLRVKDAESMMENV